MNAITGRQLSRSTARRTVEPEPTIPVRDAVAIRSDLEQLAVARDAAVIRLAELEAQLADILLTDDDAAAERHDAEIARQRRAIERADLKRPALECELVDAERREQAERQAVQQAQANAAVEAVLAEIEAEYNEPARRIAAFLDRWNAAANLAQAAGVPGPDRRLRAIPGDYEPERIETYTVWIDPNSVEHASKPQPAVSVQDSRTGQLVAENINEQHWLDGWRQEQGTRTIPSKRYPDTNLGSLAAAVRLPGAAVCDPGIWPAGAGR